MLSLNSGQAPQHHRAAAAQGAGAGEAPGFTRVSGLRRATEGNGGHAGSGACRPASTATHAAAPAPPPSRRVINSSSLQGCGQRAAKAAVFLQGFARTLASLQTIRPSLTLQKELRERRETRAPIPKQQGLHKCACASLSLAVTEKSFILEILTFDLLCYGF